MNETTGDDKRCLLLGGAGFIGCALTKHLLSLGYHVDVVSRKHRPLVEHPRLNTYLDSLDNSKLLRQLLPETNTVFYLASETTPISSANTPSVEVETNLRPALQFIETSREHALNRIIYMSSGGTVYGDMTVLPASEINALSPVSHHGAAKVAIEAFFKTYSHQVGTPVVVLRPSNVYGPGQFYRSNFGMVRKLFEHALTGEPIEIYGDGSMVRDFLYIDDLVQACVTAMTSTALSSNFATFNVGAGVGTTVNELCALVESICRQRLERIHLPERASDVHSVVLDCSLIHDVLGWKCRTRLEQGLFNTWQWLRAYWTQVNL